MLDARFSQLYFCQSLNRLQLGLSAIATVLQSGLVMAKSGRLELGDNIYRYYQSISNHCDVFGQQSNHKQQYS